MAPVDASAVLAKLVAMPIATWQWKSEPGAIRHMGPMAQDFRAVFGLGDSDTQIVTVDADGVALAAIQGLNTKVNTSIATQREEIAAQRGEIAAQREAIAAQREAIAAQREVIAAQREVIAAQREVIAAQREEVAALKRAM